MSMYSIYGTMNKKVVCIDIYCDITYNEIKLTLDKVESMILVDLQDIK